MAWFSDSGVQVVTAHAVRVAVTNNLSANITGFLPIHCIYQLLRSRSFTKHKVSIKVGGVHSIAQWRLDVIFVFLF